MSGQPLLLFGEAANSLLVLVLVANHDVPLMTWTIPRSLPSRRLSRNAEGNSSSIAVLITEAGELAEVRVQLDTVLVPHGELFLSPDNSRRK